MTGGECGGRGGVRIVGSSRQGRAVAAYPGLVGRTSMTMPPMGFDDATLTMTVQDAFRIKGRGTVLTGQLQETAS